jgi:hypothetical protein
VAGNGRDLPELFDKPSFPAISMSFSRLAFSGKVSRCFMYV